MKKILNYSKKLNREKERQRVLENFYTKQMKNGKTTRADILDKIALSLGALLFFVILLNRFIDNLTLSVFFSSIIVIVPVLYLRKYRLKLREKKIEEIKREYKKKAGGRKGTATR